MGARLSRPGRIAAAARRLVSRLTRPGALEVAAAKRRMEDELKASGYSRSAAKALVARAFRGGDG